jgi:Flp pilus assembly pilin Flp
MRMRLFPPKSGESGQTAVEYILMLCVMVSIIVSILGMIKTQYLGNPQACESAANKKKLLCKISSFLTDSGGNKHFQYYPFRK